MTASVIVIPVPVNGDSPVPTWLLVLSIAVATVFGAVCCYWFIQDAVRDRRGRRGDRK